ncbi:predicted protein [Sclerotinia sclerotiorum 1980 UF-70]|uniref:Uncharacterized protein n=2 Tax=Sclerotinia sclerotiorum (strain ATCC 18683 / 1980 / Ss-1) TaxID=665079 RepID=A7EU96_SCLS1|nr:predicted protein [Sclerotinia sclerotiorum 1980 UF-70]APA15270.1 hypothetical protein sscle_14g100400 [Sclerotinia sclerotiorum 1980 UF-70]EDN93038.1 predicted protein [Sclerotinia sclerotiorum 1980 UF-70]
MIDSSTSNFGGHSPAISDGNHCYSLSPVNPYVQSRQPLPSIENGRFKFQLQYVPEHLHLFVIAEALGADTFAQIQSSCSILYSEVRPAGPKGKRVRWEADEHETIDSSSDSDTVFYKTQKVITT